MEPELSVPHREGRQHIEERGELASSRGGGSTYERPNQGGNSSRTVKKGSCQRGGIQENQKAVERGKRKIKSFSESVWPIWPRRYNISESEGKREKRREILGEGY